MKINGNTRERHVYFFLFKDILNLTKDFTIIIKLHILWMMCQQYYKTLKLISLNDGTV